MIQVRNIRYESCGTVVINSEDYPVKEQDLNKYLLGPKALDLTAQELCISLLETAELVKGKFGKNIFKEHLKNESLHMPSITPWRLGKAKN